VTAARRADVAVIGAGITGLSVAVHLLWRGVSGVRVYERSAVGAGASGVQPGGVRQQWGTAVNCRLARESAGFYGELGERLGIASAPRLEACGYLFVAHEPGTIDALGAHVRVQQSVGVPSRLLGPEELTSIVPTLDVRRLVGGAFCPEDGYVDRPQAVVEAFARTVADLGGSVEIAGVGELREARAGWDLRLADGDRAHADVVVVAAGLDAPRLCSPLGVQLPIEASARHIFFSDPLGGRLLEPLVVAVDRRFAAKHLANGRLLASDLHATGDPALHRDEWRAHVREVVVELLPHLQFVALPLLVSGAYDMTPDRQPLVGELDGRPGLWVAAGFSGHGFMLAPAIGRLVADAIVHDRRDEAALAAFSPARFTRTRTPQPEAQVI
jgi:glycine/D-amino acid oxidase-like deaminating enzyme